MPAAFGKESKVLPYTEIGNPLQDKPKTVKVKGDNKLLLPQQNVPVHRIPRPAFCFRQVLCEYGVDKHIFCTYNHTFHLNMKVEGITLTR